MSHMLFYYIGHTLVNGIRKLFRTWMALFVVIVIGFALIGGVVGGIVGSTVDKATGGDTSVSEQAPEEEEEDTPMTEADKAAVRGWIEVGIAGVFLVVFLWNVAFGDKGGANIFTMPDVNFLFTAPLKPQSVLLFRVILQAGTTIVASLYLLFQLPNLILNAGISLVAALALLLTWIVILLFGKVTGVFVYTLTATHPKLKKGIYPFIGVVLLAVGGLVYGYMTAKQTDAFTAVSALFGAGASRFVPVIGWIKGCAMACMTEDYLAAALYFFGNAAALALFVFAIWRMKADFYEDALSFAAVRQEKMEQAAAGRVANRKRTRKVKREGFASGAGATVFFAKALYNRRRFAFLGFLTGTSGTALVCALGVILIERLANWHTIVPLGAVLLFVLFIRSFANPLADELRVQFLYMVPESAVKKLLLTLLAGTTETLIDLLPGYLIAAVVVQADLLTSVCWFLVLLTVDILSSCAGLLLQLGLPTSLHQAIATMLRMMIQMTALLPAILVISIGYGLGGAVPALVITAVGNLAISGLLFLGCPALLHSGRG